MVRCDTCEVVFLQAWLLVALSDENFGDLRSKIEAKPRQPRIEEIYSIQFESRRTIFLTKKRNFENSFPTSYFFLHN